MAHHDFCYLYRCYRFGFNCFAFKTILYNERKRYKMIFGIPSFFTLVSLIQTLLDKGFSYVLPGQMQSDRLEGEFGIYRSAAGGNYHISLDQLLNGLRLQRLKLFKRLNFEASNVHKKDTCCTEPFTEKELSCLDECFESVSNLTDVERGTVTYIAGYVTHK